MAYKVPPPDFRYVGLIPGPTPAALALAVGTAALGAFGMALWTGGSARPLTLGLLLGGGTIAALALARSEERGARGARQVAMAVVPWGVLVEPETSPRILRWPAVRTISVRASHTMHGGTPAVVQSTVFVQTDRELFSGRIPGPAGLEGLVANLDAYAEEAARPVARDLDGEEALGDGATEPVVADLLRCAEDLCASARGALLLGLPPAGYRAVASRAAAPETIALLRGVLGAGDAPLPADPRPLGALVAAMLDARELVPDLLRLTVSPHPLVAAAARAAALRLGAPPNRAGALDELASFLFEEDREHLERWAEPGPGS